MDSKAPKYLLPPQNIPSYFIWSWSYKLLYFLVLEYHSLKILYSTPSVYAVAVANQKSRKSKFALYKS